MSATMDVASLVRDLALNVALLSILAGIFGLMNPLAADGRPRRGLGLVHGVVVGLLAVLSLQAPIHFAPGILIDVKTVIVALAGAFLGGLPALVALAIVCAARAYVGGVGAPAGIGAMVTSTAIGWAWQRWRASRQRTAHPGLLLLPLGVLVTAGALLWTLALPAGLASRLLPQLWLPVSVVFLPAVVLAGVAIDAVQARWRMHHELGARERLLAEALKAAELGEKRLRLALDASGDAMWERNLISGKGFLSDRYYTMLGYAPGAYPGGFDEWRARVHPEDWQRLQDSEAAHLAGKTSEMHNEFRMRSADGQWRWLLGRGRLMRRDAAGRPELLVGTHSDIHDRREQALAMERSRQRFEAIYRTVPDAMAIAALPDGGIVDVNPGFEKLFGIERQTVVGQPLLALGLWPDTGGFDALWQGVEQHGEVAPATVTLRHRSGSDIVARVSARRLQAAQSAEILWVFHDITEQELLEQASRRALDEKAAAEAASRAKTEFLSHISHELRTPLNAIIGFAQLLQQGDGAPGADPKLQLDGILKAGWHLLDLINDMLDMTRIEAGGLRLEPTPLGLGKVVRDAAAAVAPLAQGRGIGIVGLESIDDSVRVMADERRLRQVLLNVLGNAIKYNHAGGLVTLSVLRTGETVQVLVADTGPGMDESQLAHLFEPFNRLGREGMSIEGSGLGLALSRHLLRLMGGEVTVDSRAGEGTTVTLALRGAGGAPLPGEVHAPQGSAAMATEPPSAARGHVLYIEDNAVNQIIVEQMLRALPGVRVTLADSGEAGLAAARAGADLVLLDMRLPDLDGLDVLDRIASDPTLRHLPVVAVSASAMPADVQAARQRGAIDYWTKPLDRARFVADVARLLRPADVH